MALTAAGLALTAGCGSGVDEGQVEEFESWARDQPQVQSVDSVTFEEPDTLFGGTNPEVITTLHFSPETSDEQILSVAGAMAGALTEGGDPTYRVGEREGVTFRLQGDDLVDRRTLGLASDLEDAAPDAQPLDPDVDHVAMVTPSSVSAVVPDADMADLARSIATSGGAVGNDLTVTIQGQGGSSFTFQAGAGQDTASLAAIGAELAGQGIEVRTMQQTPDGHLSMEVGEMDRSQAVELDRAVRSWPAGAVVQGEVAASAVPGATEPVNLSFDTRLLPAGQMEGLLDAVGEVPDPWTVLSVGITEGRSAAYLAIPGDDREPSAEDIARVEEGGLALTRYVDSYFLNGTQEEGDAVPGEWVSPGPQNP